MDSLIEYFEPQLRMMFASFERIHEFVKEPLRYGHPLQAEINSVLDGYHKTGRLQRQGDEFRWSAGAYPALPKHFELAYIRDMDKTLRTLRAHKTVAGIACCKLVCAIKEGLVGGDLFVPMILLRSVIEQSSALYSTKRKLESIELRANSAEEAIRTLIDVQNLLAPRTYGTRINWKTFVETKHDEPLPKGMVKYEKNDLRQDNEAVQVLKAVDMLDKRVRDARSVYEFLCEFAHPNSGAFFAFTESEKPSSKIGAGHFALVEKSVGLGFPSGCVSELFDAFARAFRVSGECLAVLEKSFIELEELEGKLQSVIQIWVHNTSRKRPDLFAAYEPCPCSSGKNFKFCCKNRRQ